MKDNEKDDDILSVIKELEAEQEIRQKAEQETREREAHKKALEIQKAKLLTRSILSLEEIGQRAKAWKPQKMDAITTPEKRHKPALPKM